jgi:protein-S-isoprenylcysteine O-methyltransferase Ste14
MSSPRVADDEATLGHASPVAQFQALVFSRRNVLAALPVVVAFCAAGASAGLYPFAAGAALVLLGAALRAWCTLFNRYAQGERKTLALRGPYSWTRNPLYVANSCVLLGCALASGALWAAPVTLVWCGLVYGQVVRHEERRLFEKYGAAYQAYRARVGGWLPRARGDWPPALPAPFLPALIVQSRALLWLLPFVAKAWAFHR